MNRLEMERILIFSEGGSSLHYDREFSIEKKEEEREDKRERYCLDD
jgi:hypothetical protein